MELAEHKLFKSFQRFKPFKAFNAQYHMEVVPREPVARLTIMEPFSIFRIEHHFF